MTSFDPGRLVMVDIPGTSLDAGTAEFLRAQKIRAVCLFRKNIGTEDEVKALMRDLIDVLGPEALIGIDQEGGAVVRVTFLPQPPSAMALGASGDAARAESVGAAVARGLDAFPDGGARVVEVGRRDVCVENSLHGGALRRSHVVAERDGAVRPPGKRQAIQSRGGQFGRDTRSDLFHDCPQLIS